MKTALILLIIILVNPALALEPENHCHDEEAWGTWNNFVSNNMMNDDVQVLHALRIGLCYKIDQGSIELDRAIDIFERFREVVLKRNIPEEEIPDPES